MSTAAKPGKKTTDGGGILNEVSDVLGPEALTIGMYEIGDETGLGALRTGPEVIGHFFGAESSGGGSKSHH